MGVKRTMLEIKKFEVIEAVVKKEEATSIGRIRLVITNH